MSFVLSFRLSLVTHHCFLARPPQYHTSNEELNTSLRFSTRLRKTAVTILSESQGIAFLPLQVVVFWKTNSVASANSCSGSLLQRASQCHKSITTTQASIHLIWSLTRISVKGAFLLILLVFFPSRETVVFPHYLSIFDVELIHWVGIQHRFLCAYCTWFIPHWRSKWDRQCFFLQINRRYSFRWIYCGSLYLTFWSSYSIYHLPVNRGVFKVAHLCQKDLGSSGNCNWTLTKRESRWRDSKTSSQSLSLATTTLHF